MKNTINFLHVIKVAQTFLSVLDERKNTGRNACATLSAITALAAMTMTAFAQTPIPVTVFQSGGGTVAVSGGGWAMPNTYVTATATPSTGYEFVEWVSGVPPAQAQTPSVSVQVTMPLEFVARFAPEGYHQRLLAKQQEGQMPANGMANTRYTYDKLNRLVSAEYSRGGVDGFAIGYAYDGNGNLTRQAYLKNDANTNAIPDLWEFLRGIDVNHAPPGNSFDHDDWTDYQKWLAGIAPTNHVSTPGTGGNESGYVFNTPPVVTVLSGQTSGWDNAFVQIRVLDSEWNTVLPELCWRLPNESEWHELTLAYPDMTFASAPTGIVYAVEWDCATDFNGQQIASVMLSARGSDVSLTGEWSEPVQYDFTLTPPPSDVLCTVTFDAQGASPVRKTVALGQPYGVLATVPARAGYTFGGWYPQPGGGGTEVTALTTVTTASAHTLYAYWIPNRYVVTFNANGGTPANEAIEQTYGTPYLLPAHAPSREGYTFAGWFTAASGGTQITPATTVTTALAHTLWAGWTAIPAETVPVEADFYVDISQPDDSGDGKSWATAKKSIQAAVNAAGTGHTIYVADGTYAPITTANKSITIQSVNGAGDTIIDGGGINRCATLGTASSHTNTVLIGFTLCNGNASHVNVSVSKNYGGGSYGGTLNHCTLTGNSATTYGGGSYSGTLNNCLLTGNTAAYGGGSYGGTLRNCTLTGNTAGSSGGGSSGGTLNNCTLTGNTASNSGGGVYGNTLNNCTLNNCIVWDNSLSGSGTTTNYSGGTFTYSCTAPLPNGTGNIAQDPMFVDTANSNFRLQEGSPCIDAGSNEYVTWGIDLDGNRRIWGNAVDMGAYEWGSVVMPNLMLYVDETRPNDDGDGLSWATAKKTIQAAVNITVVGDTIVVMNGIYAPISTANRAIIIESVNGAASTIIDGGDTTTCATLGTATTHTNTVLIGFTLTNGRASDGGGSRYGTLRDCILMENTATSSGGGSYYGTMNNCVLGWNKATTYGGGAYYGTLNNCIFLNNSATSGGGAYYSTLDNCTLTGNTASTSGGGSYYGTLSNCVLGWNKATSNGGGTYNGTLNNCLLAGNTAGIEGGGVYNGTLNNCTLAGNTANSNGGGAYSYYGTLNNCTLTGNTANSGGGSAYGTLNNCTLTGNTASNSGGGSSGGTLNNCTLASNTAGTSGGGSYGGTLNNCTLTGNTAGASGGGVYDGTLNNCTLTGNTAGASGGGVYDGTLNNCTLTGNTASTSGGGSYYGTLSNCVLGWNKATSNGGGTYNGTLNNCLLAGNTAGIEGGGVYNGTLDNCTLAGNTANVSGGGAYYGTLNNCTLTGNTAGTSGGGSYNGTLNNCVVWDNSLSGSGATTNYSGGTFTYSCTAPLPSGTGNISQDPMFVDAASGNFRLQAGSPCIDKGNNTYSVGTVDLDGNSRIYNGTVDMGAYEHAPTLTVTFSGNGGIPISQTVAQRSGNTYILPSNPPIYSVYMFAGWFTAASGGTLVTSCTTVTQTPDHTLYAQWVNPESITLTGDYYVDINRPDDNGDGKSWTTAKKTIQAAVNAAIAGESIIVWNGVHAPISTANKAITIQSVNGAGDTIIDGGGINRCATLGTATSHTNTVLIGFTLCNGNASHVNVSVSKSYGGGSYGGTLNHCTLTGNTASSGGGAYYSMLNNCTLSGNTASSGGGSCNGTLNNCTLTGNTAEYRGGGSADGTLNNCTLTGNTAEYRGGGSADGTLNNCTLTGNSATGSYGIGGGVYDCTLNNCTLSGNTATTYGGGAYSSSYNSGMLNNCTLAGNTANSGGGSYSGTLRNCIVWGNNLSGSGTTTNYSAGTFSYSCAAPLPSGTGNIAQYPMFVDAVNGDYRLQANSPCIDKGNNAYVVGDMDLDGNIRIWNGTVDMGAYEHGSLSATYAVIFDGNGGTPPSQTVTQTYNSKYALPSASPERAGYTFMGWFTAVVDGTQVTTATTVTKTAAHTLYAHWHDSNATWYVNASRPDDNGDGLSWATAKKSIQAAVDLAIAGNTVVVTNGTYAPISTDDKAITIQSVNGAETTVIDGGDTTTCATLGTATTHTNTVLIGFTLINGQASDGGGARYGTLRDCILTGNTANNGGGSYNGTLNNCTLSGNTATYNGGGAYFGTLNNCTLTGNTANSGGGSCNGTLNNCTLAGNMAGGTYGGGSYLGTLNNCTLTGNSARYGGGAHNGTLNNCTLSGNTAATVGGGSYGGTLNNCTLTGNTADSGGGSASGTLNNCIVWGNRLSGSGLTTTNYGGGAFTCSCTTPMPSGNYNGGGNIEQDPMFVDAAGGDFRLQPNSPCINAGSDAYVDWDFDLDGNPRVVGCKVDMGAYEFQGTLIAPGVVPVAVPFGWLDTYRGWQGVMGYVDLALLQGANGYLFWESYVAGLNPTDPNNRFTVRIEMEDGKPVVTWAPHLRDGARAYTLLAKPSLDAAEWTPVDPSDIPEGMYFFKVRVEMP